MRMLIDREGVPLQASWSTQPWPTWRASLRWPLIPTDCICCRAVTTAHYACGTWRNDCVFRWANDWSIPCMVVCLSVPFAVDSKCAFTGSKISKMVIWCTRLQDCTFWNLSSLTGSLSFSGDFRTSQEARRIGDVCGLPSVETVHRIGWSRQSS